MDTDKRVPVRLSHTLNTLMFVLFTEGIYRTAFILERNIMGKYDF